MQKRFPDVGCWSARALRAGVGRIMQAGPSGRQDRPIPVL